MLKDTLLEIFERDLRKLMEEVLLYKDESLLWQVEPGINNSAGNLCIHLTGNINHFIGAVFGQSGYIRNRDNEFTAKNVLRSDMIAELEKTIETVKASFAGISDQDLLKDFPIQKHGESVTTGYMLLHLMTHFNYHLGQINYHRRLLENK